MQHMLVSSHAVLFNMAVLYGGIFTVGELEREYNVEEEG